MAGRCMKITLRAVKGGKKFFLGKFLKFRYFFLKLFKTAKKNHFPEFFPHDPQPSNISDEPSTVRIS